jgi:anti-sigma regulatory factor (Ser/Thr protein kinase)
MGMNGSTMLEPLRQGLPPVDPSEAAGAACCGLPARYEAVGAARRFTSATLQQWGLGDHFDDIALVVSELVTNALRHAVPDAGEAVQPEPGRTGAAEPRAFQDRPVRLQLTRRHKGLVCAVRDPSVATPRTQETEDDCAAESGRGLFLVESFSDDWGWHPLGGTLGGKVVWALFVLRGQA